MSRRQGRTIQPSQNSRASPQTAHRGVALSSQVSWAGPLPPPAALEHFNKIVPGGAERIFKMTEKEQEHRIIIEGQTASIAEARRGQLAGALISTLAVVWAGALAYVGANPWGQHSTCQPSSNECSQGLH